MRSSLELRMARANSTVTHTLPMTTGNNGNNMANADIRTVTEVEHTENNAADDDDIPHFTIRAHGLVVPFPQMEDDSEEENDHEDEAEDEDEDDEEGEEEDNHYLDESD